MKKLISGLAVVVAFAAAGRAQAAGFQLDVMSGRGTGMATALTASVDDATSVFYNPAGMVRGQGHFDIAVGDTLVIPKFTFTPASGGPSTDSEGEVVPPPHVYAYYGFTDDLSLGIGEFTDFGSVLKWPETFPGRYLVREINLTTFKINPSLAFRLGERVRIGVGVQVVRSTVELQQDINFVDSQGSVDLAAGAWGAGGNAGVQVDILPHMLTFGASYRSPVDLTFSDGKAHFSNVPIEFASTAKDQGGSVDLTLPSTLNLGLSFHPIEALYANVDVDYTGWQTNSSININFNDPSLSQSEPKNWHHSWNYHFGAEYTLNPQITLRAGLLYDPTPGPVETLAPDLPDMTRINVCLGGRYTLNNFKFDLGYQLVILTGSTSTNPLLPGDYKGLAHVVALTASFGK